ncbi:MAG TPA: nicotinamide riboside transporter PnuC [Micromonosporaceae bacterium]
MLNFLNATALRILGEDASWAELGGFVTGLICVWLVVRQHIANWPVGMLNVVLLMVAFWASGLYGDAGLQIVYVILGCYGWWVWWRRGSESSVEVRRTTAFEWVWLSIAAVAATVVLYWLLRDHLGSQVPAADAITTTLSLVATYGQCRKLLENWWFWILADVIYVPLYAYKHLYLTTVLYVVFLILSTIGLIAWRRDLVRAGDVPVVA